MTIMEVVRKVQASETGPGNWVFGDALLNFCKRHVLAKEGGIITTSRGSGFEDLMRGCSDSPGWVTGVDEQFEEWP